jgi:hypothetical protein
MPLLSDEQLTEAATKRATFRLVGVTTKLSPNEAAEVERLAKKRGQPRGEFIRQLILTELRRNDNPPTASVELSEIVGVRLMLTNLLKPLTTGLKITPEVFDGIMVEVKKRKTSLAVETKQDLESA